jgi:phage protein D
MAEPKKRGRPPKRPGAGSRRNYAFRMTDATRDQVVAAADKNGRSMSEELEARIEASFAEDRMRAIAREEIEKAQAGDATQRAELMKRAISDGRGGWFATNQFVPPSQFPKGYNY